MKREAENSHRQNIRRRSQSHQLLRTQHALKGLHQRRKGDGQPGIVREPAKILQGIRYALQKMRLALIEPAKSISPERLHDADVYERVVVLHERGAVDRDIGRQLIEVK